MTIDCCLQDFALGIFEMKPSLSHVFSDGVGTSFEINFQFTALSTVIFLELHKHLVTNLQFSVCVVLHYTAVSGQTVLSECLQVHFHVASSAPPAYAQPWFRDQPPALV